MDARFTILGPTGIRVGDRVDTQWGRPRERALLAVLLTRPGTFVPAAELIDWIWPDRSELPRNPKQALYLYSSRLRAKLESLPNRVELSTRNGAYRIDVGRKAVDYFRFLDQVDRARELSALGDHRQALSEIRSAFAIWRHQVPLQDLRSDRAETWRRNVLMNRLMPAYDLLCQELLALGEHQQVIDELDDLELDYRIHHGLLKRRLHALYRLMRTEEASRLYLTVHKALRAEPNDAAADSLRKFHDGLQKGRTESVKPAARAPEVLTPQQLPLDVPLFVGHEDKFAALDHVASEAGLVLVSGQGGVGKTAFAVHWAHTRRTRFPGGVLFADLQGFSDGAVLDAATVVDRFLLALGVRPDQITNPDHRMARLQSLVSGRRLLVLLDNAYDTEQIRQLLPLFSSCLVIVTSRSRLSGLAARLAPHRISIDPLGENAAARLLLDRIGERAENTEALAELTRVCSGLPIALKVLANHIATRPNVRLSAFVDHFRERGVLDIGTMHGPRAVFMQSLRALEPDARLLFRTIGVHPGPDISVSTAAAMVALPTRRVHAAFDTLVEATLVEQANDLDRFKLHDLLREFSSGLLDDPQERMLIERRMFDFYLRTAENADMTLFPGMVRVLTSSTGSEFGALEFKDASEAERWCMAEVQTVLAVVRLSVETGAYSYAVQIPPLMEIWPRRGMTAEMLSALRLGLAATKALGESSTEAAADLMQQIGHSHLVRQEYRQAEHYVHSAHIAYLQAGGDQRSGIASCLHTGARILVATGNIQMGIDSHERALSLIREIDERGLETFFLFRAGEAYQKAFEYERAASYYHQALMLARAQEDEWAEATVLQLLGSLSFSRERVGEARAFAQNSLWKYAGQRAIGAVGEVLTLLCQIEEEAGNVWEATQYARQAVRFCGHVGASLSEATALCVLARILGRAGRREAAVEALERAWPLLVEQDAERASRVAAELERLRSEIDLPEPRSGSPVFHPEP
ncbi:DNA-binding transcriptional activator of the SARP family [Lentzea fradiae]|uniref:DNA-binding transcriptional activator of the SARP family n=1 Tax=Lentzea fradiae TaxID=200378 RepID=A0A1G7QEQ9_9PSEU|nr:DNA-binding transcriptional activator of the SARP family [Lentzea fradiae]